MGRLVGLELHNFKSYRGTVSVGFGSANFTSIIGPNGSGKSNMMDAISFVLGVRSSHLRSAQIKDLIYRGRVMDESADDDDEAETDPEKAYVMAVYEKGDGEMLKLKRTITAAGQSLYRINDKTISAVEYSNILKKENILIKARNFLVFQGDVEQIASQSAVDLSKLLEIVSGSTDHKREYDELKDEQDKAKEHTTAILSKRRTLVGEVKQYKEQSDEAELFKEKLIEKNELVLILNLWKLYHIDQKKNSLIGSIKDTKAKLKSLKNEIAKEDAHFKEIKTTFAKESLKLTKFQKLIDAKKQEIKSKKQELLPLTTEIDHLHKKITQLTKNSSQLTADITTQEERIEGLERNVKTVKKSQKAAVAELTREVGDISPEDHEEYQLLKQKFLSEGGGAAEDEKLSLLMNQKREIEIVLANLDKQRSATSDKVEELQQQQYDFKAQLTSVSRDLNELNDKVAAKKSYIQQLHLAAETFMTKEFELQTKIKEVLITLDDLNANQRETNRERNLRQNVATLKRVFPGVIGLLVDLVAPVERQYSVALNTILGKHLDAIVVESSAVAHQCIQYLKKQRSGVASFIPLDIIEATPVDSRLRHLDPRARPTVDVVEYDAYLDRAVQFACGDSMVCDDIRVAKDIRWSKGVNVKVVCLNGTLISKSNTMTAGYSSNQERRWNKGEVQKLNDMRDKLTHELDLLYQTSKPDTMFINNQESELQSLQYETHTLRRQRVELERALMNVDAEMKYYSDDFEVMKQKKEQSELLQKLEDEITKQEATIESLQEDIFQDFCSKHNFKSIKEYEMSTGSKLREQSRELRQYDNELMKLNNKLTFEKERCSDTKARLERVKSEFKKQDQALKKYIKTKEDVETALDGLEAELAITIEDLQKFERSNAAKVAQIRDVEERMNDAVAKQESLKKEIELRLEDVEKYESERVAIFTNCNIENVKVPTTNQDFPIDTSEEVEVDYSKLPSQYKSSSLSAGDELEEKIDEVTKKLQQLTPNVKAIERLREVKEKLSQVDDELSHHRQQELQIVKKFQEVKTKRYDTFMNAFTHISEKIDPIYKELTKKDQSTQLLGGSAYLTLEDEDEPYLAGIRYHAMPPNKRFKDMELLSGGEKTIAALALLFAIHSFHPSPFFVLDEVDAALDHNNVNQIAKYITKHASPDFQFIVISLKNALFERSDALVGIYREQKLNSSRTLTLDLRSYPEAV